MTWLRSAHADELDQRAQEFMSRHEVSYIQALRAVLSEENHMSKYTTATAVEREIKDWITRALEAGMAGALPGALGQLCVEADSFRKIGMPIEEAARRAIDLSPSLVAMAAVLLVDIRRNAPELVPTGEDKPAVQGNPASFEVHARAEKLMQKHPHMDYREAVGAVLSEDTQLKVKYAGVK
jgi:hypothetical protein